MDNRVVGRSWQIFLLALLFLGGQILAAGCYSAPSTVVGETISPSDSPVIREISTPPTPLATKKSPTPLPTSIFPPPPPGLDWPVKNVEDLRKVFEDAPVVLIRTEGFLYCPPFYDPQGRIESKVCTNLNFEVGEQERQRFIAAIEEGVTQSGQIPTELLCAREIPCWEYPAFSLFLLLPEFSISLHWYTERSFAISQTYYPNFLQKNIWYPISGDFEMEQLMAAEVGFVQEKPTLYKAVKETMPSIVFPPEYFGHVLEYERVVTEHDGKICEYHRGRYPSFSAFMHGMLARSVPVDESYLAQEPRAIFTFWVHGKAYPVKMWEDGRFSYRGQIYQYIPREIGEPEPSFQVVLEEFLLNLGFTECTSP